MKTNNLGTQTLKMEESHPTSTKGMPKPTTDICKLNNLYNRIVFVGSDCDWHQYQIAY